MHRPWDTSVDDAANGTLTCEPVFRSPEGSRCLGALCVPLSAYCAWHCSYMGCRASKHAFALTHLASQLHVCKRRWPAGVRYPKCNIHIIIGNNDDHMRAGQSHDGYFEFSRQSRVRHVLGSAKLVSEAGVSTKDQAVYPADMVVFCGGCEYQGSPPFLADLKLGEYSEMPASAATAAQSPGLCIGNSAAAHRESSSEPQDASLRNAQDWA